MRRFVLPEDWDRDEPLMRRVQELLYADRHRSAMDEVLRALRHDPESVTALFLAQATMFQSRTVRLSSPEPLTDQQRRSALLSPIMTECTECLSKWSSHHQLMLHGTGGATTLNIMNPLGIQCQECRYTLCRNCYDSEGPDAHLQPVENPKVLTRPCPEPGCPGELHNPVLPTGRSDVTPMDPNSIEGVAVIRDGLIPPTTEEALRVITDFVPLTVDDGPLLHIRPGVPGRMADPYDREDLAYGLLQDLETEGTLTPGAWPRSTRLHILANTAVDTDYLITVVRKPAG